MLFPKQCALIITSSEMFLSHAALSIQEILLCHEACFLLAVFLLQLWLCLLQLWLCLLQLWLCLLQLLICLLLLWLRLGWPFISYHLILVCVNYDLNGSLRINSRLGTRLNNQLFHPIPGRQHCHFICYSCQVTDLMKFYLCLYSIEPSPCFWFWIS